MGADLVLIACRQPIWADGSPIVEWSDEVETIVRERLSAIEPDDLDVMVEETFPFWEEEPDATNITTTVGAAREAVESIGSRMTVAMRFGDDHPWLVTGGTSWGDNPSDEFHAISLLSETGIFDAPFEPRT